MSIFKHDKSGKCISFGDFGFTCNGKSMILEDCGMYDDILSPSDKADSTTSQYKILYKGNNNSECVVPNNNGKLKLGNCGDNSIFTIYHNTEYKSPSELRKEKYDEIRVQFIFSDNTTSKTDEPRLWCKKLFNASHKPQYKNIFSYFILYNFDKNTDFTKLFQRNGIIECNMKLVVDEYEDDIGNILKSTTYYLVPSKNMKTLVFSAREYTGSRLVIRTSNVIKGKDYNVMNFGICNIGMKVGRMLKFATLDFTKNRKGFILGNELKPSNFRVSFMDNIDRFQVIYKGISDDISDRNIKLANFRNPVKKMVIGRNGTLVTRNLRDTSVDRRSLFEIIPASRSTNLTEGMTTQNHGANMNYNSYLAETKSLLSKLENISPSNLGTDYKQHFVDYGSAIDNLINNINNSSFSNDKYHAGILINGLYEMKSILTNSQQIYNSLRHHYGAYKKVVASISIESLLKQTQISNNNNIRIPKLNLDNFKQNIQNIKNSVSKLQQNEVLKSSLKDINLGFIVDVEKINLINEELHFVTENIQRYNDLLNTIALYTPKSSVGFLKSYHILIRSSSLYSSIEQATREINERVMKNRNKIKETDKLSFYNLNFYVFYNFLFNDAELVRQRNDSEYNISSSSGLLPMIQIALQQQIRFTYFSKRATEEFQKIRSINIDADTSDPTVFKRIIMDCAEKIVLEFKKNIPPNVNMSSYSFFVEISNYYDYIKSSLQSYSDDHIEFSRIFYKLYEKLENEQKSNDASGPLKAKTKTDYYSLNFFLNYLNRALIDLFVSRFNMVNKLAANNLRADKTFSISVNSKPNRVANIKDLSIEGFSTSSRKGHSSIFNSKGNGPMYGNICKSNYFYNNSGHSKWNQKNVINEGLLFKNSNDKYVGWQSYVTDKYTDYSYNSLTCKKNGGTYTAITISGSYERLGSTENILNASVISPGKLSFLPDDCANNNACDISATISLEYTKSSRNIINNVKLVVRNKRSSKKNIPIARMPNINVDDIISFNNDSGDKKTSFRVSSSKFDRAENKTIEMLYATNDENDIDLSGTYALYSSDFKLRLILKRGGTLKIQYIPKRVYDITGLQNSKYGTGEAIYFKDLSVGGMPYQIGDNFGQIGYVGLDNKLYNIKNKKRHGVSYEQIEGTYGFSTTMNATTGDLNAARTSCKKNSNCYGYIHDNGTHYLLTDDNKNHLYKGGSGTLHMKKFGVKISDGNGQMINIPGSNGVILDNTSYSKLIARKSSEPDDSPPSNLMKYVMQKDIENMNATRDELKDTFTKLVNSFNKLSKNEMEMLNKTGINVGKLNKLINDFDTLYKTKTTNSKINTLLKSQSHDTKNNLYVKSQYSMAFAGILSVSALLFLFNTMKK